MTVLICIPMYNFAAGVLRIIEWVKQSEALGDQVVTVLLFDDGSRPEERKAVEDASPVPLFVFDVPPHEHLAYGYKEAGHWAERHGYDVVLTCESDIVPNDLTFQAMMRVFQDPPGGWEQPPADQYCRRMDGTRIIEKGPARLPESFGEVVTVSCMYQWQGRHVYPWQPVWDRPSPNQPDCYQIQNRIGMAQAVPFAFALWKPEALLEIDDTMPKLYRLDTALGLKLWNQGKIALRLLDHAVAHWEGGKQSR